MDTKQRTQQKLANLQQEWDLLNEKLSRLERAKILETRADEVFRLEHTIEEVKKRIQNVEQELKNLEYGSTATENEMKSHENDRHPVQNRRNSQVMDSTLFILQEEVPGLIKAVMNFAGAFQHADDRRAVLSAAGIDASFMSGMKFDTAPVLFANLLVARLKEYKVSTQRLDYHPLIALCSFWLDTGASHYGLDDQDAALCQKILARGRKNLNVIEKIDDTQQVEDTLVRYKGKPPTLAELRKHLADFLQTAIDLSDSTSQKTFIDQVGFEARLRQQIHFGGVQSQFISLLISTLMNYGTLDDGRDALEAVLETAKGYVSKNQMKQCDELIQELRLFREHT